MNTPIREILGKRLNTVFSVPVTSSVYEAVTKMNKRGIGCVVVLAKKSLVGIFTERDVLTRVIGKGLSPKRTTIGKVMTPDPKTILPTNTVGEVLEMHSRQHFRHLPVVEKGIVVGMVSVRDLLRYVADENAKRAEKLEKFIESGTNVD